MEGEITPDLWISCVSILGPRVSGRGNRSWGGPEQGHLWKILRSGWEGLGRLRSWVRPEQVPQGAGMWQQLPQLPALREPHAGRGTRPPPFQRRSWLREAAGAGGAGVLRWPRVKGLARQGGRGL